MKFTLMSDLHLEFDQGVDTTNKEQADVLVLAGDILIAEDLRRFTREDVQLPHESRRATAAVEYRKFLDAVTSAYKHVVWVAGNHEFYHGKFFQTLEVLHNEARHYTNLHFLEDEVVTLEGVTFVGSTLWTNCNNHDPLTLYCLQYGLNDYRVITNDKKGYTKLRPAHTLARHVKSINFIEKAVKEADKVVAVTHHAPSFQSIAEQYKSDKELNGGYASSLEETMLDNPNVKFWCHGHVHSPFDYEVGDCRVVANPRGYPGENENWEPKTYEV